jgi:twitching motility protein PilT
MPASSAETLSLNTIFSTALEKKATDIHLIPGNYPVLRLDSKLFVLADEKVLSVDIIASLVDAWLTPEEKQRLSVDKEVRTIYTWADRARFRASVFYQQGYPAISLRAIPHDIPDPKTLGVPDLLLERVLQRQGLIILCGPFNAGRTTTMASLLHYVNQNHSRRMVTLERPIEYMIINTLNQRRKAYKSLS